MLSRLGCPRPATALTAATRTGTGPFPASAWNSARYCASFRKAIDSIAAARASRHRRRRFGQGHQVRHVLSITQDVHHGDRGNLGARRGEHLPDDLRQRRARARVHPPAEELMAVQIERVLHERRRARRARDERLQRACRFRPLHRSKGVERAPSRCSDDADALFSTAMRSPNAVLGRSSQTSRLNVALDLAEASFFKRA